MTPRSRQGRRAPRAKRSRRVVYATYMTLFLVSLALLITPACILGFTGLALNGRFGQLGFLGELQVNVLESNLALDEL